MLTPGGLRVAVLDHTAQLGGAELALERLLGALPTDVSATVVLFADGPLVARLRRAGVEVEVIPLGAELGTMDRRTAGGLAGVAAAGRILPFAIRLARRLRALNVDVVHANSLKADLIGVLAAVLARKPLVWHVHDRISPDYLPPGLVRLIRGLARHVPAALIANSRATADTVGGDPARVAVAYPGLASAQIRADVPRVAPPSPVVGVVGRISPTKAQMTFVRAAAEIAKVVPEARFRIVGAAVLGGEDYEEQLGIEIERLGLSESVALVGFVSDPVAELDGLTVCVHTAAVPEPFGQVVAEAMARRVPVVATAGGGVDEILEPAADGRPLGWLVPAGDEAALAKAVLEALTDPAEAERRSERAYRATTRFTVERTADVVVGVWRAVAGGNESRPR